MPPKKRPSPAKGAATAAEPTIKRGRPRRGVAATESSETVPQATPDAATLAVMFDRSTYTLLHLPILELLKYTFLCVRPQFVCTSGVRFGAPIPRP